MILAAVAAVLVLVSLKVASEYERGVVFRLGRYAGLRGPGLYLLIPLIETQRKVDLRTRTVDVERQETITRDSVTIKINAVLWYRVTDPAKAVLEVVSYEQAVYQVALTSFRNIIGQHYLDEVLNQRDKINATLREMVDAATDGWGVEVSMVEMKDIEIPEGMQRAMAREAEAVREKRARIIKAEAEQESSIKLAESAGLMAENPYALELRRMQMIAEIGVEQNTTTLILMPSEFANMAGEVSKWLGRQKPDAPKA